MQKVPLVVMTILAISGVIAYYGYMQTETDI